MTENDFDLAIIVPANNEAAYIGDCLSALMAQSPAAGRLQIIVAGNACTDGTEDVVREFGRDAKARGWELIWDHDPTPGKLGALNRADNLVRAPIRAYLDADVVCDPELFGQLREALSRTDAAYATGTLAISPARSPVTRAYASFWRRLPFVRGGGVGAGLFAVNAAGRARWEAFPAIISDDTFARLNFAASERFEVPARYHWPMVEGLGNLIRVRHRQNAGVKEVYQLYPALKSNENKAPVRPMDILRLAVTEPLGFLVYGLVHLVVRLRPVSKDWVRGR